MTGWQSNLILTLPLIAVVVGGLGLRSQLERWFDGARDGRGALSHRKETESCE